MIMVKEVTLPAASASSKHPTFKILEGVLEIHFGPVHVIDICYPTKFGISDSREMLKLLIRVVWMKSGSHTQTLMLVKFQKGARDDLGSLETCTEDHFRPKLTFLT